MTALRIGKISTQYVNLLKNLLLFSLLLASSAGCTGWSSPSRVANFDGGRAYQDLEYQVGLGPRIPGEQGHARLIDWLVAELGQAGWEVEIQQAEFAGKSIKNVIASRDQEPGYLLLGAHFDTRIYADQDPDLELRGQPVPGANDGASGVAVLLELARVLPVDLAMPVRLVFFDAEDNGGIADWDWILGSRAFVSEYTGPLPAAVVIVDMVGDADLEIFFESNSDPELMGQIWGQARDLGYGDVFQQEYRHSLLDDHTPFLEAGIPAVDIIDFDYPDWHTMADTLDKTSPQSLEIVGRTLEAWLLNHK